MIDSYDNLTIEKYKEIMDIDKTMSDIDIMTELLSILSDKTIDEIEALPLSEFNDMVRKTTFLKDKPKPYKIMPRKVTVNGKRYDVEKDAFSITAGQYIDYRSYVKTLDDIEDNLPKIMTVFLIPEGHKYGEGYDLMELADEFLKTVSISLATSVSAFFLALSRNSIKASLRSLASTIRKSKKGMKGKEREMMEETLKMTKALQDSLSNGFGLTGLSE